MRAYEVERRVFARRRTRLEMDDARLLADTLCDLFAVPRIHVLRNRNQWGYGSWFYPPRGGKPALVALSWQAPDWVVCHEVAHWVTWYQGHRRGRECGHGHEWALRYCIAVGAAISDTYAVRLARAMEKAGVLRKGTAADLASLAAFAELTEEVPA